MNLAVVMRQVPDLVEPLEVAASGTELDWEAATFVVNEADDHALEQALLLKEAAGGQITVLGFDHGDVDNTLFAAAAKGADRIIKMPWSQDGAPCALTAAALLAQPLRLLQADLVLVGSYAHDELDGSLGPQLALQLQLPFLGVVRGVQLQGDGAAVMAFKEYPAAVMAKMRVSLPAVLGILAAEKPPRYVPVSRIRAVMKSLQFEQPEVDLPTLPPAVSIRRLYPPVASERAEMLRGAEVEVASRIVEILKEKGLLK